MNHRLDLEQDEREERERDMNYSIMKRAFARKVRKQVMDRMKGKRRSIWAKQNKVWGPHVPETKDFKTQVTSKKIKDTLEGKVDRLVTPPSDGRKYVFITN